MSMKYPELERVLRRNFDEWKKEQGEGELPVRVLATRITNATKVIITHSSLFDWLAGRAKPQSKKIEALAKFFAPSDEAGQIRIMQALEQATQISESSLDPLEVVES